MKKTSFNFLHADKCSNDSKDDAHFLVSGCQFIVNCAKPSCALLAKICESNEVRISPFNPYLNPSTLGQFIQDSFVFRSKVRVAEIHKARDMYRRKF
jgi:hypothetical protein